MIYPESWFSSIPDPGCRISDPTRTKKRNGKKFSLPFYVAINFPKLKVILLFEKVQRAWASWNSLTLTKVRLKENQEFSSVDEESTVPSVRDLILHSKYLKNTHLWDRHINWLHFGFFSIWCCWSPLLFSQSLTMSRTTSQLNRTTTTQRSRKQVFDSDSE